MAKGRILALMVLLFMANIELSSQKDKSFENQHLSPISCEDAGVSQDSINRLLDLVDGIEIQDFRSLVVIKNGGLLIESYYNTYWKETIHDIRSAGKSITALCMGIAIKEGFVKSYDESVYAFFPNADVPEALRRANSDITIKDLMMMSSGLDADTDDGSTRGFVGNWIGQDDWVTYMLNVEKAYDKGSKWVYNDGSPMLCSAIITQTTGLSMAEFAEKYLFEPLGVREYYWYKSKMGITGGMGNLYITNLDFAKFGQLVLEKGRWGDQQLIAPEYIEMMTAELIPVSDNGPWADGYGFFWYSGHKNIKGKRIEYKFATGNGGNKIYVIPSEEMVIAVQSSSYGTGRGHGQADAILEFLLHSLE